MATVWDRYCDAVQDVREQSGYASARPAVYDLARDLKELEERIALACAAAPERLFLKARMVAVDSAFDGLEEQFESASQPREPASHFKGLSLEPFPLTWNQLFSLLCRIFDGEPDPLRRTML